MTAIASDQAGTAGEEAGARSLSIAIVAGLFVSAFFITGLSSVVVGLTLEPIRASFHETAGRAAQIASIRMLVPSLLGPIVGYLVTRFSPRLIMICGSLLAAAGHLIASFAQSFDSVLAASLLMGIGFAGCSTMVSIMIVSWWTGRHRALAIGIFLSSAGIGPMLGSPFVTWVIERYGWRVDMIVSAVMCLTIVLPISALVGRRPPWVGLNATAPATERMSIVAAELRKPLFWLLCIVQALFGPAVMGLYVYAPALIASARHSAETAAYAFGALNLFATFGAIGVGMAADRLGARAVLLAGIFIELLTLALAYYVPVSGIVVLVSFVMLFGTFDYVVGLLAPVLIAPEVKPESFGVVFGSFQVFSGVSNAVGPLAFAYVYDIYGSYRVSVLVAAAATAASLLPATLILLGGRTARMAGERA